MSAESDSLAASELERHRPQMLYAERQLLKTGEYETLASSLVRRSRIRLVIGLVAAAALCSGGRWFHVVWAGVIVGALVLDHSHARRTLATIQRLQGAGATPAPPGNKS